MHLTPDDKTLMQMAVRKHLKQLVLERMALDVYRPNPGPQEAFHRSLKRLRFVFGGNRAGKTVAAAVEAAYRIAGEHPFDPGIKQKGPQSGWIVSPTFEVQREAAQRVLLKYLPQTRLLWVRPIYRDKARDYLDRIEARVAHGRGKFREITVTFKSAEQGRTAFQGASIPWIWIDEEVPIDIFTECLMRVMDVKGEIWGAMTPLIGEMYQYITEDLTDDPELDVFHLTWEDNPYLDPVEKKRLMAVIPEEERETRVYGRWAPRTGRVFRNFREEVHVIDPLPEIPDSWRKIQGLDFGQRAPTAVLWVALDEDGRVYVYDEYYQAETPIEAHAANILGKGTTRTKADPSLWNRLPVPIVEKAQKAKPESVTVASLFRRHGVRLIPASKGSGTWGARMNLILEALRYERDLDGTFTVWPNLYITSNCVNLIKEMRSLIWKPSKSGMQHEATQGDDHAVDALGYALEDVASLIGRGNVLRVGKSVSAYKPRKVVTGY